MNIKSIRYRSFIPSLPPLSTFRGSLHIEFFPTAYLNPPYVNWKRRLAISDNRNPLFKILSISGHLLKQITYTPSLTLATSRVRTPLIYDCSEVSFWVYPDLQCPSRFVDNRTISVQDHWLHTTATALFNLTSYNFPYSVRSQLGKFFSDVPLSFRSLERLTIADNLNRPLYFMDKARFLHLGFDDPFKVFTRTLNFRKMKTLWVSKVTQCTLTPARNHFLGYHNKFFLYQKKITKFLFNFYNRRISGVNTGLTFSVKQLILNSGLLNTPSKFEWYLMQGFIYFNFAKLPAELAASRVKFGDVISLTITPKLSVLSLYWNHYFDRLRGRFFYFLARYRLRASRKPPKQPSFRIPKWVDRIYFDFTFTSRELETDFLTQSSVYLRASLRDEFRLKPRKSRQLLPFLGTIRTLNWKSLT